MNAKTVIALVRPKDIDGLKQLLSQAADGQISCVHDLAKLMQELCPGLLDALRILMKNITVLMQSIAAKLSSNAKELIKKVIFGQKMEFKKNVQILLGLKQFYSNELKKIMRQLDNDTSGMISKMLDDLMNALPSLKPMLNGVH